jgi:hypothetical protein
MEAQYNANSTGYEWNVVSNIGIFIITMKLLCRFITAVRNAAYILFCRLVTFSCVFVSHFHYVIWFEEAQEELEVLSR